MSLTYKAVIYQKPQTKGSLESRPNPMPGKGQISVEITAAAVNPVDHKILTGIFPVPFPTIVGSDGAGIVHSVGTGVKDFKKGDRVYFQGQLGNQDACTFQQKCLLDANLVSHTPDNVSDAEASGIQLASMVCVVGLYHEEGAAMLRPLPWEEGGDKAGADKAIVVLGGSSSVGQYAIQLARLSGFTKIITTSSSKHADYLKSLGAHVVLDREDIVAKHSEAAGSLPISAVFDAIGSDETLVFGKELLQEHNKESSGSSHYISVRPGIEQQNLQNPSVTVRSVLGLNTKPELADVTVPFIKAISGNDGWVGKGQYKPNRMQKVDGGLNKLNEALDMNKEGVSGVKLWLDPRETTA